MDEKDRGFLKSVGIVVAGAFVLMAVGIAIVVYLFFTRVPI